MTETRKAGCTEYHINVRYVDLGVIAQTSGQAGVVFGYKLSADYWIQVIDLADGHMKTYQMVNGTKGSAIND